VPRVARYWRKIARKAAAPAAYWLILSLTSFVGMKAVIKIETTRTRLFLLVVVIAVAFVAASLLEQLLRRGQPAREGWPRWYSHLNNPMLYRSSADRPYSYVVLPQRTVPVWLSKRGERSTAKLLTKGKAKARPQAQELLAARRSVELDITSSNASGLRRSRATCRRWQAIEWIS
jgi:hypothetical protein